MKKDIKVTAKSSETRRIYEYTFSDLGITQAEWEGMTDKDRAKFIEAALSVEPEQPYWYCDDFEGTYL